MTVSRSQVCLQHHPGLFRIPPRQTVHRHHRSAALGSHQRRQCARLQQWLVNDWLAENNYTLNNVAVFDFYNVLTGRMRITAGIMERSTHITGSKDTLAYPSGDDHPSETGSRKATEEFIPLLNVYYHRWAEGTLQQPLAITEPASFPTVDIPVTHNGEDSGGVSTLPGWVDPATHDYWLLSQRNLKLISLKKRLPDKNTGQYKLPGVVKQILV